MCSGGVMPVAALTTWSTSVSPPTRCSTLARLDFMRVPRPAARITTLIGDFIRLLFDGGSLFLSKNADLPARGAAPSSQLHRDFGRSPRIVAYDLALSEQIRGDHLQPHAGQPVNIVDHRLGLLGGVFSPLPG